MGALVFEIGDFRCVARSRYDAVASSQGGKGNLLPEAGAGGGDTPDWGIGRRCHC